MPSVRCLYLSSCAWCGLPGALLVALLASLPAEDAWTHAWSRELPPRQPAWAWNTGLPRDDRYRLVLAGDVVLIGTTGDQTLRAIAVGDGAERWRVRCDGALRLAPVVVGDRIVVGSDDGLLRAVDFSGREAWRYRPGPDQRQMIAHVRLQSSWPITAGPGCDAGVVYGGCGMFAEDGIWAFAVDLADGGERWLRRAESRLHGPVEIRADAVRFGAIGAEEGPGDLTRQRDNGSRSAAARPDPRKVPQPVGAIATATAAAIPRLVRHADGRYLPRAPQASLDVAAAIAAGSASAVALPVSWHRYGPVPVDAARNPADMPVDGRWGDLAPERIAMAGSATDASGVIALTRVYGAAADEPGFRPPHGDEIFLSATCSVPAAGLLSINATADWWMQILIDGTPVIDSLATGNQTKATEITAHTGVIEVAAGEHRLIARVRPGAGGWSLRVAAAWSAVPLTTPGRGRPGPVADPVDGKGMVIQAEHVGDRLLLLTDDHRIHAFQRASVAGAAKRWSEPKPQLQEPKAERHPDWARAVSGWVLLPGVGDGQRTMAMADQRLPAHLVVADPDASALDALHRRLSDAGLMNDGRVQLLTLDAAGDDLPPWCFGLIEPAWPLASAVDAARWARLTRLLRPHGGALILPADGERFAAAIIAGARDLALGKIAQSSAIIRAGAIADTADWNHEFATPGNAAALAEPLVRFPLAAQWAGGPADSASHFLIPAGGAASQEGTVMQPQAHLVARGMWLLQGIGQVTAIDQYTGRQLWQQPLPPWHAFEIMSQSVATNPLANRFPIRPIDLPRTGGFNMACDVDSLYIACGAELRAYDLDSGRLRGTWKPPAEFGDVRWGTVRAGSGVVLATLFAPTEMAEALIGWDGNGGSYVKDRQRMLALVCFDARSGAVRWTQKPKRGFINHGVALGADRVFCLDLIDGAVAAGRIKAGLAPLPGHEDGDLATFALVDGRQQWRVKLPALLTDIAYLPGRDLVLLPSRKEFKYSDGKWIATGAITGKGKNDQNGLLLGLRGADGSEVYRRSEETYFEPYSALEDRIVQRYGMMLDPGDGRPQSRPHPVTGASATQSVVAGGCTWIIQSQQWSAGRTFWNDLVHGLSSDFAGIDGGCTPIHLPAGGLVNINNVSVARFANRSRSVARALVHRDRLTAWADDSGVQRMLAAPAPVRRLGLLPGAPGNRGVDGSWWVRVDAFGRTPFATGKPAAGAATAAGVIEIPEHRYRLHANSASAGFPAWAGAWALLAPPPIDIPMAVPLPGKGSGKNSAPLVAPPASVRLRIVVVEPDPGVGPGARRFAIRADGVEVARGVDARALAGAARVGAIIDVQAAPKGHVLRLECLAEPGALPPVLGAILVEALP